jgi:hypothetical protein
MSFPGNIPDGPVNRVATRGWLYLSKAYVTLPNYNRLERQAIGGLLLLPFSVSIPKLH